MTALTVRKAGESDTREIAAVHVRAWRAAFRGLVPDEVLDGLSVADRERDWRTVLSAVGRSFTFVGIGDEQRVEGFCTVAAPGTDEDAGEHTAEVVATYVDPQRWRAGIGSAVLEAALSELGERGWQDATLWVLARNDQARAFYANFGFEPDGAETKHDWSGEEVAVRLRARLLR
jgi:GNAT superfamily N-acetyltransferase